MMENAPPAKHKHLPDPVPSRCFFLLHPFHQTIHFSQQMYTAVRAGLPNTFQHVKCSDHFALLSPALLFPPELMDKHLFKPCF